MAEEAPAAAGPSKSAGKAKKKPGTRSTRRDGPTLPQQITEVIAESQDRKGLSVAAIKKVLAGKGLDVVKTNKRINATLVGLVDKGVLLQTSGVGASGSFKLAKRNASKPKPKPKPEKKKPAVKKQPAAAKRLKSLSKKGVAKRSSKKSKKPAGKKSKPVSSPRKTAPKAKKPQAKTPKKGKKPALKKAAKKPAKKPAAKKAKK
ncbi:histone H1-like [Phyllopteryx taeniolatus]|uniref:histone H1-like n=1 Tax=Phyllopteryx taeniolatus TaxID=161469 RepID=UPI002AD38337|nr:histone H1-like [Phyllopteryx taeniolatus]